MGEGLLQRLPARVTYTQDVLYIWPRFQGATSGLAPERLEMDGFTDFVSACFCTGSRGVVPGIGGFSDRFGNGRFFGP